MPDPKFLPLQQATASTDTVSAEAGVDPPDWRLERLIRRLPGKMQTATRWLRRPAARWLRLPAGLLLIVGGLFSILPILGVWMLPLGLLLVADDIPPCRRLRTRLLDWIERRRPHWLGEP